MAAQIVERKKSGPPGYQPEEIEKMLDHILQELSKGRALSRILREDDGMPSPPTVIKWQEQDPDIAAKVVRAREIGIETLLDETLEIADTPQLGVRIVTDKDGTREHEEDMLGHRKLRIDTRQKYAQMIAPRKYGNKLDVTSGGEKLPEPASNNVNLIDVRMQSLIALAAQRQIEAPKDDPAIEDLMS